MNTAVSELPSAAPHLAIWPKRLPRELSVPRTSLWFNLDVAARRYPDKAAYLFFGRALSFVQLHGQATALAGWLQSVGVGAGDRVALFMQNCPQFSTACYAVWRANAVLVPVNPMNRAEEFKHYIADPQTKVVICSADLAPIVHAANDALPPQQRARQVLIARYADALPAGEIEPDQAPPAAMEKWLRSAPPLGAATHAQSTVWSDALAQGHEPGPHAAQPDDLAMLPYTSGTTGLPKGCMHTHATLMPNAVGGQWSHAGPETVSLAVVPMFHITGMVYSVLACVYSGSTCVIMPRWDRELAGRLISHCRITHWTCIPTMVIDLFASPNYRGFDLSSLRNLSGGGAAMPQAVAQRLLDEFGLTFAEGYGLTETAAPTHANPPDRAKLQCLGIPIFGVDSRIVDPITLQELPLGEAGEIVSHGPMVFKGYWRHPEATAAAFIELDGKRFFPHRRPRPHRRRRLLLHHGSAQAHDQCERLQGLAGRGGGAVVSAPGGARGVHHRGARCLPRRDRQGCRRAARGGAGQDVGTRHRRLVAQRNGGVQGATHRRVCRRIAQVGFGQSDVAFASGSRERRRDYLTPGARAEVARHGAPKRHHCKCAKTTF